MTLYSSVKSLGLEGLMQERGNVAAWRVEPDYGTFSCANCNKLVFNATPYCDQCGSLMVNYVILHQQKEKTKE